MKMVTILTRSLITVSSKLPEIGCLGNTRPVAYNTTWIGGGGGGYQH
jgi:hypothetical protein